jgi:L-aminopeptidase/D-esterase-like protein
LTGQASSLPTQPAGCGPANCLHDVAGLRVGHATLAGDGWLTGVTVVVSPPGGAVGGVDVRGGGPGTRETDLLDPRNAVERVNAIVLGGGSAYGLNAAHGVMTRLAALRRGVRVGSDESQVVPIVPAAILYDLGRGGVFGNYPGPDAGAVAFDDAMAAAPGAPFPLGGVGAGTGALAGGLKGGVGSASVVLAGPALSPSALSPSALSPSALSPPAPGMPVTVAALAVVNSAGAVADERSGILHGARFGLPGEFDWLVPPSPEEQLAGAGRVAVPARGGEPEPLNTTIGVVATDASLTKAQCAKLAGVAHDGMARAIRPAHSMFDGDTVFALATGDGPGPAPLELHAILTAAADCFTRAVVHAVLSATSVTAKNRTWPGYLDLYPSADTRLPRMPRTPLQDGRRRVRRRDLRHRQRLVRRRRVDRHGRPLHPRRNRYVWRELISAA